MGLILLGCGFCFAMTACSSADLQPQSVTGVVYPSEHGGEVSKPSQELFKVSYSGPEGSGSMRLVLRRQGRELFQLMTSDALGRSLWSLQADSSHTVFVDHRRQVFCFTEEQFHLNEVTLKMFPISSIPQLLQGELPVDLPSGHAIEESGEFEDSQGRRWSVRRESNELTAWTLWVSGLPTLWWTKQTKGGILSHRDGGQFRWRRVIQESMDAPLVSLTPPDSFQRVSCDEYNLPEFRQDQSALGDQGPPE
jgi:outer membrane biogenesis lipoprotein LolB